VTNIRALAKARSLWRGGMEADGLGLFAREDMVAAIPTRSGTLGWSFVEVGVPSRVIR